MVDTVEVVARYKRTQLLAFVIIFSLLLLPYINETSDWTEGNREQRAENRKEFSQVLFGNLSRQPEEGSIISWHKYFTKPMTLCNVI